MRWLRRLFERTRPCDHKRNYRVATFPDLDGRPRTRFQCFDCWLLDEDADPADWPANHAVVRDGKLIIRDGKLVADTPWRRAEC